MAIATEANTTWAASEGGAWGSPEGVSHTRTSAPAGAPWMAGAVTSVRTPDIGRPSGPPAGGGLPGRGHEVAVIGTGAGEHGRGRAQPGRAGALSLVEVNAEDGCRGHGGQERGRQQRRDRPLDPVGSSLQRIRADQQPGQPPQRPPRPGLCQP